MRSRTTFILAVSVLARSAYAGAINVDLGNADPFAVLAGSTVTNTGTTTINGILGVWPGTAITGASSIILNGTSHAGDSVAMQAQNSLTTAYNFAAGEVCGTNLTGQDLGGLTLTPGVYCFFSSAQLTGTLTLNALGNPNSIFVFQIGSTLTTASNSSVVFTNGGQGDGLFWQVGSSATLGTTTTFAGNILALTSITLNTGATIPCGRALASSGAVTLQGNLVSIDTGTCEATTSGGGTAPEPKSWMLLGTGLLFGMVFYGRRIRGNTA